MFEIRVTAQFINRESLFVFQGNDRIPATEAEPLVRTGNELLIERIPNFDKCFAGCVFILGCFRVGLIGEIESRPVVLLDRSYLNREPGFELPEKSSGKMLYIQQLEWNARPTKKITTGYPVPPNTECAAEIGCREIII